MIPIWIVTIRRWVSPRYLSFDTPLRLQWRHDERDGVSIHQLFDCLLNRLRHRSKKTSKLRVTGLCDGNSPVADEFPAQRASNAENVSIFMTLIPAQDIELPFAIWLFFTYQMAINGAFMQHTFYSEWHTVLLYTLKQCHLTNCKCFHYTNITWAAWPHPQLGYLFHRFNSFSELKIKIKLAEWRSGSVSAPPCERPGFASRTRLREIIPANNCTMQGQNNWGNWGSPGVMKLWVAWEVLRWLMKFWELCNGGFHPKLVTPPYHGFLNVNTPPNSQNSKRH